MASFVVRMLSRSTTALNTASRRSSLTTLVATPSATRLMTRPCRNMATATNASAGGGGAAATGQRLSPMLLVFPTIAAGLGTWQVYRKQWKESLINEIESKLTGTAVPMPGGQAAADSLEWTRVTVTGEFLNDKEMLVGPRTVYRELFASTVSHFCVCVCVCV